MATIDSVEGCLSDHVIILALHILEGCSSWILLGKRSLADLKKVFIEIIQWIQDHSSQPLDS